MSGGFFRGTSADQDTRFSNKQAKLLKSQKFASELDHLVDMTKVQMDVIRPWIATRATEFLGFEDEVLINFIYGLLDAKEVDGKQIQIQLTGFMEKNTGKFMKELWSLLLSAQKNVSGVPQQFLDAKEEETRKKKAEADRITLELQRMKETEGRELEQELSRKMDGEMDVSRTANTAATLKNSLLRTSEDREAGERLGSEGKNRLSGSPHAVGHALSPNRSSPLASRSRSKSFSNSRSYSGSPYSSERRKSRTISGSPQPQQRSLSPERRQHSPVHSPRRKHSPRLSPSRRRLPHLMRRSPSAVRHRSPSPAQYRSRSPVRRRSRTPVLRRFPSPYRRRYPSPIRRRSPSPIRRRSPSPIRRRSPSPYRRRSPSPPRRRSPLARSPRYRRRSPLRSPRRRVVTSQNSPRRRNRSRSPYGSRSPPYRSHRSLSRERDGRVNGVESRRYQDGYASQRGHTKRSPDHHILEREDFEHPGVGRKGPESVSRQPLISLRSPQRDARARTRNRVSVLSSPPEKTSSQLDSPLRVKKMNLNEDIRKLSASVSPERPTREQAIRHDTPEISAKELEMDHSRENLTRRDDSLKNRLEHSLTIGCRKKSSAKDTVLEEYSPSDYIKSRKNDSTTRSDSSPRRTDIPRLTQQASRVSEEIEYGPGRPEGERFSPSAKRVGRHPSSSDERFSNEKVSLKRSYAREGGRVDEKKRPLSSNVEYCDPGRKSDSLQKFMNRVAKNNQVGHFDSDGEETESYRIQDLDKRKSKRQDSSNVVWNNEMGYASPIDDRKEAKRRKKEEKRLRKEERRRRREERHCRREERRAGKLKAKTVDTVAPPSNYEKKHSDADDSEDGDVDARRDPQLSETEETESEQKKLEIELRKKALESLRAKKAISH